jgi:hypothetical protein
MTKAYKVSISSPAYIVPGGSSTQFLKADGSIDSNSYMTVGSTPTLPDIIPLDSLQYQFDGIENRFYPTNYGNLLTINNPFRLLISVNGIIQSVDFPEYVFQGPIGRNGFQIDSDGYIAFNEVPIAGSSFDGRLMTGPDTQSTYLNKNYPFRAVDILLGA